MNKKAIGSVFVALALVLALLKSYVWVMVGLLIAAIVFAYQMGGNPHQFLSDCICRFRRRFLLARQGYAALWSAYRCHL